MPQLFQIIQELIANGQYIIGQHASERMEERDIMEWQVVDGFRDCVLLVERAHDKPFASIEVEELLPDGTEVKVVWSYLPNSNIAKLVTVHYFDENWS
jgi:hypothetical protein